jgi:hypothetical protein
MHATTIQWGREFGVFGIDLRKKEYDPQSYLYSNIQDLILGL